MTRISLEYEHSETISASLDPVTREVTFDDKVVTGKMWLTSPGRSFVEIIELGGYYLQATA